MLLEQKRAREAEAEVNRALALMPQGPRRVGILGLKALRTLPGTQRSAETEQKVEQELKALEAGPHAKL